MLNEMGLTEEGFAAGSRGTERRGLGAGEMGSGGADAFDSYRNQKSKRYHVAAEERQRGLKDD